MRLWSIHPSLLDAKGLVALWRETLLAKHVLEGKTKGYKNHPQLDRFKSTYDPLEYINTYLHEIYWEAKQRGYNFNQAKINYNYVKGSFTQLPVTYGQLYYEWQHLLTKIKKRDKLWFDVIKDKQIQCCNLFYVREGGIESWERTTE